MVTYSPSTSNLPARIVASSLLFRFCDVDIDDFIIAEAYIIADPSTFSDVYGDMFLKKYVTALFKKQWGQNLIKFEGLQLPGGVTLNGRQLYDDATTEIDRIEEEVQLKYQLPDDFFVG